VLAAITVAGATGRIGWRTVVLTLAFAVGTAVPLLAFALAGRGVSQRVRAFRLHQRRVRTTAGVVLIALAVALTFNLSDVLQRAVPDYTGGVNSALAADNAVRKALGTKQNSTLASCADKTTSSLQNCGAAPTLTGISSWFNTADNQPVTPAELKGKVVLIDFWAYSCINCQRAIPHVEAWYARYRSLGLEVIGVHTPEYAFEHDRGNVVAGAKRLKITYPVALDNDYATWDAFSNQSWPADYLIDATGVVRYAGVGEGAYSTTEGYIRQLLTVAHPGVVLPAPTDVADTTPTEAQTPETYLGSARANSYVGATASAGTSTFQFPKTVQTNGWALSGGWTVGGEFLTSGQAATIRLNFLARNVYLDVGGTGTLTATVDGRTSTYRVSGAPNIYTVVSGPQAKQRILDVTLSPGLQAYSFTFG
jgi:thiol-disulfide isomerase/thioredoxin